MLEDLAKAEHSAGFVCDNLRHALDNANGIEGLILLERIEEANKLRQNLETLRKTYENERGE